MKSDGSGLSDNLSFVIEKCEQTLANVNNHFSISSVWTRKQMTATKKMMSVKGEGARGRGAHK